MPLSVVCLHCIGCRSVLLKGTPNGSALLPSPQPAYATTKKSTILKLEKTYEHFRKIVLHILNMLNIKRLTLIATEI